MVRFRIGEPREGNLILMDFKDQVIDSECLADERSFGIKKSLKVLGVDLVSGELDSEDGGFGGGLFFDLLRFLVFSFLCSSQVGSFKASLGKFV